MARNWLAAQRATDYSTFRSYVISSFIILVRAANLGSRFHRWLSNRGSRFHRWFAAGLL
jgi:hypothetical protein